MSLGSLRPFVSRQGAVCASGCHALLTGASQPFALSKIGIRFQLGTTIGLPAITFILLILSLLPQHVAAQDYWKARDLLTNFVEAVADENALNISAVLQRLEAQPSLDYFSSWQRKATLATELSISECRVDYALMKKGNTVTGTEPRITVQFKEVPKGVWERFWVVDNVFDERGNALPDKGFSLNSTSGNFTELSDQVRDIATSDFVGLAPYGKLNRSYLAGRQFNTDINSTRLTFNNIQLLDSTGAVIDYVYVTMGYQGYPQDWYIADIGPMSKRWLGRDRYIDFLIGRNDSLLRGPSPIVARTRPVLVQVPDTTILQKLGDTTYFAMRAGSFDTLYYQVAQAKNALSVGRSSQLLGLRMYPLHAGDAADSAAGPRERGPWSLGICLGGSRNFATLLGAYSTGNVYATPGQAAYLGQTKSQIGLDLRYQLMPRISLGINLAYQQWGYRYHDVRLFSDATQGIGNWVTTDYTETIQTLGAYLYGTYELRKPIADAPQAESKAVAWIPYAELGAGYGLMLAANATLDETLQPGIGSLDNTPQTSSFAFSTQPYRKMPYVTPGVGLGLRLETRRSDFWVALRYRPMTWNVVRYKNADDRSLFPLSQGYYRIDDDLGLQQVAINIGYAFVFRKK
jgi:hypothetical protein